MALKFRASIFNVLTGVLLGIQKFYSIFLYDLFVLFTILDGESNDLNQLSSKDYFVN